MTNQPITPKEIANRIAAGARKVTFGSRDEWKAFVKQVRALLTSRETGEAMATQPTEKASHA